MIGIDFKKITIIAVHLNLKPKELSMEPKEIIDLPPEEPQPKKRPVAITVICILGFIGVAVAVPLAFSGMARIIGDWYPPYLLLSAGVGLACMIGLWKMKKWGAYTYTAVFFINQTVLLSMDVWSPRSAILPLIVVGIALSHLKNMD